MNLDSTRADSLRGIMALANQARRAELTAYVAGHTNYVVQAGPFAGMAMLNEESWGAAGDLVAKLLGFYEEELYPAIESAIATAPDLAINVGCAEGFYAIGLARRLPEARIAAFDIDVNAQMICRRAAQINQALDRMDVMGQATPELLQALLASAKRPYLIMDCEGAEIDLLDLEAVPALAHTRVLVECHDFVNRALTPLLTQRFSASHDVMRIDEGARNPNRSPLLSRLHSQDRWLAISENRPEMMNWLDLVPRG